MAIENVRIGGLQVLYDGVEIGLTSYDTATEIDTNPVGAVTVRSGKTGATPLDEIGNGMDVQVSVPLIETTPEIIASAIPGSEVSGTRVTVKNPLGLSSRSLAKELKLVLVVAGEPSNEAWVFPNASPKFTPIKQTMKGDKVVEIMPKFQVWPDATTGEFYYFDTNGA